MIETTLNDIKERLSLGFATLVAARAGCQVSEPHLDRGFRDITISPVAGEEIGVDVQLKASSSLRHDGDDVVFDLPVNNYNHLRNIRVGNARILVVVELSAQTTQWIAAGADQMVFRRCAYWTSLYDAPPVPNASRKRIRIPRNQLFTPDSLREILRRRFARIQENHGGL